MRPSSRPRSVLRRFIANEASGGLVLMGSAALALVVANSPLAPLYAAALHMPLAGLSLLHWINDGLMAMFFLLIGLEIKREVMEGELATWPDRALPGFAALGGMLAPAAIYAALNAGVPGAETTMRGWAIPAATDIAFSLGVLALLGRRAPLSLKIFLTALAILDDLGAVVIIALFYAQDLSPAMLAGAGAVFAAMFALNQFGVRRLLPYLALAPLLWLFVLQSGVHATIAGVLAAATIPMQASPRARHIQAPLHRLENALQPFAAYVALPVFGLANAGVALTGLSVTTLMHPVTLGAALGLFLGKQLGVFGGAFIAVRLGLARRPQGAGWLQLYGVSLICGIGFTMSLFIALLAFDTAPELQDAAKLGVLAGSLVSGLAGWGVLRWAKPRREPSAAPP